MAIADWTYEGDTNYCIPSIQSSGGNPGGCIYYDLDHLNASLTADSFGGYYRNVTIPSGYDKYILQYDMYGENTASIGAWYGGHYKTTVRINDSLIYYVQIYQHAVERWYTVSADITNVITLDASNKIHIGWLIFQNEPDTHSIGRIKIDNVKIIGLNQI